MKGLTMRLLVCGDRNWDNKEAIEREIRARMPEVVIQGEAKGADSIAREIALDLNIKVESFHALWHIYGRAAGPIRNKKMIEVGKPDEVIAFHSDMSKSKGTKNMVALADLNKIPVTIYES